MIDEQAMVHPEAKLGPDVQVGPWTLIDKDVEIGAGTKIGAHVVIKGATKIGPDNRIFQFASIGEDPQDKKYKGERTYLEIGAGNTIREFTTLNRGTEQGGGITRIGDRNLFMAYVHIAHDCIVGNDIIFSNNATLAGHVTIHDHANLSAFSAVHQFCHVGEYSFLAKGTLVVKDVPPYFLVAGLDKATAHGLNVEGLRRHGFSQEVITSLRRAYKTIYRKGLSFKDALSELKIMMVDVPQIELLVNFLQKSERGIVR